MTKYARGLFVCVLAAVLSSSAATVRPVATDEALVNPGMGWVYYHYDNSNWYYGGVTEPGDTLDWFPGASVIYFRIPWCDVEPKEGEYRWDVIDTYAQPWLAAGKQLAFRLTCEESGYTFATPEWVRNAGAKGAFFDYGKKNAQGKCRQVWEPDWLDPVFLAKFDRLLANAAARWDRESTAFVDVGSFGMWGEGHTGFTSRQSAERQAEIARIHAQMHKRHFRVAPVVVSDDVAGEWGKVTEDHPLMSEMRNMGVGFRDDSIMVCERPHHWFHQKWARKFAEAGLPVVVETRHFWNNGDSMKCWLPDGLSESTVDYRAHYQGIHWWPRDFLEQNRADIAKTNRRLGYRFELREASWPDRVGNGDGVSVSARWVNVGVTAPLEPVFACWTLLDGQGKVRWTSVDERTDFRSLAPCLEKGELPRTIVSSVRFGWRKRSCRSSGVSPFESLHSGRKLDCGPFVPTVAPGTYTLAVSLGRRDGTPRVALPHDGQIGTSRRYALGQITIDGAAADGRWMAVPMVDARLKAAAYAGGEGCQWVNCVAVGGKDGRLVVMGNDTGGVYRSCDAGLSWEPATVGYGSRGAVAMAIDPDSPERVLAVGSSGTNSGLFLSEDGAATWRQVLCVPLKHTHDYRTQLAFDRKSHMAYWASRDLGLYRSQDSGLSWQQVDGGAVASGSEFAVSGNGCLLAGTKDGLFASGDCGASWRKVLDVGIKSICALCGTTGSDRVWVLATNGVYVTNASLSGFDRLPFALPSSTANNFRSLCVSPFDSNRMLIQDDTLSVGKGWTFDVWLTEDGGRTWTKSVFDRRHNLWGPYNPRPRTFAFSVSNPLCVHSYDSDLMYVSADGGRSFRCESTGYNAILASSLTFNVCDPSLVALSAQDYNGALSDDNGKTWNYVNWSGKAWGGHVYGAYRLDRETAVAGVSDVWRQNKEHVIRIASTQDGGRTVVRTSHLVEGEPVGCGAKGDPRRVFFGEWISRDGAKTWTKMCGCTGVYFCDEETGKLLGVNGKSIVWSDDNGETWSVALEREGEKSKVASVAYDRKTGRVYFNFWSWSLQAFTIDASTTRPPVTEIMPGSRHVCGVAVDAADPSVVYAVGYADNQYTMENVWRSEDGGLSWRGLCRQPNDGRQDPDGANQARGVSVNPLTREPFVITHCCGVWRYVRQSGVFSANDQHKTKGAE